MKKLLQQSHRLPSIILVITLFACSGKTGQQKNNNNSQSPLSSEISKKEQTYPEYARLFSVEYDGHTKIVRIKNPFDTASHLKTYLLVPRGAQADDDLPPGETIRIPVRSVGLPHTTHIGFFNELGLLNTINGVSQKKYIKNQTIRQAVESGKVGEFGPSHNINVEKLLQVKPELLFVAPFKDNRYQKVRDVGIPIAVNSSYMETTPLARAEWIKFISYFFNREQEARQIFDSIAHTYNKLKAMTRPLSETPTIFSGKKIGQTWYVPGGKSYMADFFQDAGAHYLWKGNQESGSLPLDFETVYMKAKEADYWCILENFPGDYTYEKLGSENIHYSRFDAFSNRRVIFCNTHNKPYYEEGILEPHMILADLISIIHPGILPGHDNKYYELLSKRQ